MQLYTGNDIARGAGIFDHVMANDVEFPTKRTPMRRRDAIGIIAAALASNLSSEQVSLLIGQFFSEEDSKLLFSLSQMYNGDDERLHLWNMSKKGEERLCWNLRYYSRPEWRLPFDRKDMLAI